MKDPAGEMFSPCHGSIGKREATKARRLLPVAPLTRHHTAWAFPAARPVSASKFRPCIISEKIGMNKMFATRLMAKGKATIQPTLCRNACPKTRAKLTKMIG